MTTLKEITYIDWQFKFDEVGGVAEGAADINQCIGTILKTQKGSVPHRPTFGSNIYKYIDYPINIAKANIIRETIDAINEWEKRVDITSVTVEYEKTQIIINVHWTLKETSTKGSTEVVL